MKHITKKQALLGVFSFFMVGTLSFLMASNMKKSDATMAGFSAGNIISDYVMGNYNSMNESQIQAFLKSKNSCNDTGTYKAQQYPNYSYHIVNGHFVCMADENFNGESAAHIIYRAAQDYHINPQVLIVLLQKEQGLVTDTWPNSVQYRSATGYGCPDTAACDSQYYGLKNQIRNAAELYRWILDHGSKYYPVGWNNVRFSPNAACGSSRVNIENNATAALYQYTPYQPNAAAINAGYGTGDACSAYGNRNFYNYFTDWFGDTRKEYTEINIPEGDYYIQSQLDNNKVLDISNGSSANGANIQLYESNKSNAQIWNIKPTQDGYYTIKNPYTNKVLDISNGSSANGANIQLYESNNTCAQKWSILDGGGSLIFVSACAKYSTIDVSGGSSSNGANIQLYYLNNTNAQKWQLMPVKTLEDGTYTLSTSLNNNKVIDIAGGIYVAKNNTNIQIYDNNNTMAQHWNIKYIGAGLYTIKNPQTGKSLNVSGASINNGTNIGLYDFNNTCAQQWRIVSDNGKYIIISSCSYKVIDVYAAGTKNGTNVHQYEYNGTNAQKWILNKINNTINPNKEYIIRSALQNNKVIDVYAAGISNGTNVHLYEYNGTNAQKWKISYDQNSDSYIFKNPASNKTLDVAGAGNANYTNIQIYTFNNTCAQRWHMVKNKDSYTFLSACSGRAIDVSGANTKNGTNIQIYDNNNTNAQKWKLD